LTPARLLAAAFFALAVFQPRVQALPAKSFVVISDIHFNPLANPALAPQLMAADPSQWEAIFSADPHPVLQRYNEDSTWTLLALLVAGVREAQPEPGLILVSGDILAHKLVEKFATATGSSDPAAFRLFVQKTVAFVGLELQKASSGSDVVYAVGNNDDECGDYSLEPGGPFLQDTQPTVESLAQTNAGRLATWPSLASYATPNPLVRHHRILALNTTFWSRRYANTCGDKTVSSDPGALVMTWLSNQLHDAKLHRDKVWLVYHIPPGIDGHSSSRTNQTVPMWKPDYAAGFNKLLDQYRETIDLNLAGHTHLDDFRLVKTEHATTLVLINPGVSPNVGQSPAFRVITLDSHAHAKDLLTYYLPDLAANKWQLEYSTRAAFGLKRIDAQSYELLYQQIGQSPSATEKWKVYYAVSRPAALNSSKSYQRSLYCATGYTDPNAFAACLKDQ